MSKKTVVPDAWEDDWETQADKATAEPEPEEPSAPAPRLTKAERLAQHVEENRKLWESAESPETFHFVESQSSGGVPLVPPYQKQVKVLSRRPQMMIAKRDGSGAATTAMGQLALGDDDEDEPKEPVLSVEEVRERQAREREEKRKRYEEARARIFGEPSPSSSQGEEGPSSNAQSRPSSQNQSRGGDGQSQRGQRGRGRGRGRLQQDRGGRQAASPSPGRAAKGELFDPNYTQKPNVKIQKRSPEDTGGVPLEPQEQQPQQPQQPIREPRVPGRGAGFAAARSRAGDSTE